MGVGCAVDANLSGIAWYCWNAGNTTHPVAGKGANAWGLYDMLGNVWEWNWDRYGAYPAGPGQDYLGSLAGDGWVRRGGDWRNNAQYARSADRDYGLPEGRDNNVGFRPARTLEP